MTLNPTMRKDVSINTDALSRVPEGAPALVALVSSKNKAKWGTVRGEDGPVPAQVKVVHQGKTGWFTPATFRHWLSINVVSATPELKYMPDGPISVGRALRKRNGGADARIVFTTKSKKLPRLAVSILDLVSLITEDEDSFTKDYVQDMPQTTQQLGFLPQSRAERAMFGIRTGAPLEYRVGVNYVLNITHEVVVNGETVVRPGYSTAVWVNDAGESLRYAQLLTPEEAELKGEENWLPLGTVRYREVQVTVDGQVTTAVDEYRLVHRTVRPSDAVRYTPEWVLWQAGVFLEKRVNPSYCLILGFVPLRFLVHQLVGREIEVNFPSIAREKVEGVFAIYSPNEQGVQQARERRAKRAELSAADKFVGGSVSDGMSDRDFAFQHEGITPDMDELPF